MVHIGDRPAGRSTRCSTCCAPATSSPTAPAGIAVAAGPAVRAAYAARGAVRHRARLRRVRLRRAGGAARRRAAAAHVSTDLHARSVYGPVFDLPTTMAKLLAVGVPLTEVVDAATVHPARALACRRDAGRRRPGRHRGVHVLEQSVRGRRRAPAGRGSPCGWSTRRPTWAGRRLVPRLPAPPPPWIPLTDGQRAALVRRERDLRALLATRWSAWTGWPSSSPDPSREATEDHHAQARREHRQGGPGRRPVLARRRGRRHRLSGRRGPALPDGTWVTGSFAEQAHAAFRTWRPSPRRPAAAWTRPFGSASTCATSPTSRR